MNTRRILVVEDDPLLAMGLEDIILVSAPADVVTTPSVADAERELKRPRFNFAFLDVNVADGKSYKVADILLDYDIPFAFVSANARDEDILTHLRHVPFLPKPYKPALLSAMLRRTLAHF